MPLPTRIHMEPAAIPLALSVTAGIAEGGVTSLSVIRLEKSGKERTAFITEKQAQRRNVRGETSPSLFNSDGTIRYRFLPIEKPKRTIDRSKKRRKELDCLLVCSNMAPRY
ncbi:hypothetical protein CDAR_27481 [Caerostris darwini]|uniref:Uncharacterized protein n=1 Tax=Caerostris darwini TaxID=1538125 RepID=A0AAV4VTT4_9ARAC|nr:hypothetical protein CDAR_27481 [Caerostris darwini]